MQVFASSICALFAVPGLLFAADFTINTVSIPVAQISQPYSQKLSIQDGTAPIAWTYTGTLPRGLSFSSLGLLSGTPSALEVQNVSFNAKDAAGKSSTANFDIATARGDLSIATRILPQAFAAVPYTATLQSIGGKAPYKYSLSVDSSLAFGLVLDPTGTITGTPNTIQFEFITLQVSDDAANSAITRFPTSVSRGGIRFANFVPALASVGKPYAQRITVENTPGGFVVNRVAGNLPYGLSIDSDGNITGTPLVGGVFRAYLSGRDRNFLGLAATELVITVSGGPILFLTTTLPKATQNQAYLQTIQLSGGVPPFKFDLSSSALPAGLTLSQSGTLSGTPTAAGTFPLTVRATDSANLIASLAYSLTIDPAAATGGPILSALTSAANYIAEGVVPGEVVAAFGSGIGPATLTTFTLAGNSVPTILATARLLFDGIAAPILYAQDGQLSAVVPFAIADRASTQVVLEYNGKQSAPLTIAVLAAKPALFTADGSGKGPGAILNENGSVNTQSNPAAKGSIVVLYLTGAGQMQPSGQDGQIATAISQLTQTVTATVADTAAEVLYSGNAPGIVQGVVQINMRLSLSTASGAQPISLQISQATTKTIVTVWVQ